jgi:hypothetical protein
LGFQQSFAAYAVWDQTQNPQHFLFLHTFWWQEGIMVSLAGYPLPPAWSSGKASFPFSGYDIVVPTGDENWVPDADRRGKRLSRVRNIETGRYLNLNAQCTVSGCSKGRSTCNHTLYWRVHLQLDGARELKWVQYSRLIMFASEGIPCRPEKVADYVVHHESYTWQRLASPESAC